MVFGFLECAAIATYIVFVFMKIFTRREKKDYTKKYTRVKYWMWRLLRLIMGALLVVSIFYFTLNALADSWQLILGYVMFIVFVVLKDLYCANKHKMTQLGMHMLCNIVLIGVAIIFLIAMVVEPRNLWQVNVGCFSAYLGLFIIKMVVWLIWWSHNKKNGDKVEGGVHSEAQNIRRSLLPK